MSYSALIGLQYTQYTIYFHIYLGSLVKSLIYLNLCIYSVYIVALTRSGVVSWMVYNSMDSLFALACIYTVYITPYTPLELVICSIYKLQGFLNTLSSNMIF